MEHIAQNNSVSDPWSCCRSEDAYNSERREIFRSVDSPQNPIKLKKFWKLQWVALVMMHGWDECKPDHRLRNQIREIIYAKLYPKSFSDIWITKNILIIVNYYSQHKVLFFLGRHWISLWYICFTFCYIVCPKWFCSGLWQDIIIRAVRQLLLGVIRDISPDLYLSWKFYRESKSFNCTVPLVVRNHVLVHTKQIPVVCSTGKIFTILQEAKRSDES